MIAEVRKALADAIDPLVKSTAYVTDQVNTPQAMVVLGEINYNDTFEPIDTYNYTVTVYATREARTGQTFLDELREREGDTSLKVAIESDSALKELIQYVSVIRASAVREAPVGDVQYLAVDFEVQVVA